MNNIKTALERTNKLLEADAKRYEWVLDNCTTVGGGHGVQVSFFVPVDHEDLSCAISIALITVNSKSIYLGSYDTPELASEAYLYAKSNIKLRKLCELNTKG